MVTIPDIQDVVINGESLGLGGYLDIGIIDTMKDLFVNFIGAVVFSLSGFFFARSKGRRKSAAQGFVPSKTTASSAASMIQTAVMPPCPFFRCSRRTGT